jgi:hypothetical protein
MRRRKILVWLLGWLAAYQNEVSVTAAIPQRGSKPERGPLFSPPESLKHAGHETSHCTFLRLAE